MDTNNQDPYTGILLAGGKSSRMGSEKGLVMLEGISFIEHILKAVVPLVHEIIIVSNNQGYDKFGHKRVHDLINNSGPLAGLYTGLYHSQTEKNIVLSCDVPFIKKEVLQLLLSQTVDDTDIVQCQNADKVMPLVGVYKKKCAKACLELLDSGEKRLMQLSKRLRTKIVVLDTHFANQVRNINTKEELEHIQNEHRD